MIKDHSCTHERKQVCHTNGTKMTRTALHWVPCTNVSTGHLLAGRTTPACAANTSTIWMHKAVYGDAIFLDNAYAKPRGSIPCFEAAGQINSISTFENIDGQNQGIAQHQHLDAVGCCVMMQQQQKLGLPPTGWVTEISRSDPNHKHPPVDCWLIWSESPHVRLFLMGQRSHPFIAGGGRKRGWGCTWRFPPAECHGRNGSWTA